VIYRSSLKYTSTSSLCASISLPLCRRDLWNPRAKADIPACAIIGVRLADRFGDVKSDRHAGHAEGQDQDDVKQVAEQFAVVNELHRMTPIVNTRIGVT